MWLTFISLLQYPARPPFALEGRQAFGATCCSSWGQFRKMWDDCKTNAECHKSKSPAALLAAVFPEVPRQKHMKAVREDRAAESLPGIYYSCRKSQKLENRGVSPAVTDSIRFLDVTTDTREEKHTPVFRLTAPLALAGSQSLLRSPARNTAFTGNC